MQDQSQVKIASALIALAKELTSENADQSQVEVASSIVAIAKELTNEEVDQSLSKRINSLKPLLPQIAKNGRKRLLADFGIKLSCLDQNGNEVTFSNAKVEHLVDALLSVATQN